MRDGRRHRLGLATGTANPNDEDVSTTGIGSLINMGDLYTNSVADQNATTGNQAYLDRILEEQGPDTLTLDPGAYVNTRDNRYINDAYNYYLGGGTGEVPTDTAEIPEAIDTLVDTSGEGQATSGLGLDDTTITGGTNLNDYEGMGDMTGGVTNDNIIVENIAQNQTPYDVPMDMDNPGASIENIIAQQNQTIPDDPSINAFDINEVGDPSQNMLDVPTQDVGLAYTGDFDPNDEGTVYSNELENFEPEQQGLIDQAFSKVGSTASDIMNDLSQIPGAVVDFANQTIDIFGKKINVGKTLLTAGINRLAGGPISLVFDAVKAIGGTLPQDSLENSITRSIAAELTAEKDYGYNMQSGNIGQDPFGRNPVSAFGNYEQTLMDDINNPSNTNLGQKKTEYANDYFDKKAEKAGGVVSEPGTVVDPGYSTTQAEMDAFNETPTEKADKEAGVTTGDAGVAEAAAAADREAAAAAAANAASVARGAAMHGGGGGNSGGGSGDGNSPGGGGGYCFDPSTPIQMADGSTKKIKNIQLGDDTKGGEVTGVFQFKAADEIHDYKGVTVAGSHFVKENNEFIMVKDSPLAVKIDKIPVVYSLDTSARRIFIKDIEFADYNGDGVAKNFLSNAGVTLEGFDKEVLRQVQQRLI